MSTSVDAAIQQAAAGAPATGPATPIVIKEDRSIVVPTAMQQIAVQCDNEANVLHFVCPRNWADIDLAAATLYINVVTPDNSTVAFVCTNVVSSEDTVTFDWVVTEHITEVAGKLSFLVCARDPSDPGNGYRWHSNLCDSLFIAPGIVCTVPSDTLYPPHIPLYGTDTTLTEPGVPADAAVVGDRLNRLEESQEPSKGSHRNLLDNAYWTNPDAIIDQRGGYVVPPGTTYYGINGEAVAGTTGTYYTIKSVDISGNATFSIDGTDYWCKGKGVRGYTGPYGAYTIDRWLISGPTMALLVNSDCISFVDTVTDVQIRQKFEEGILESGRTYTISALVKASSACTLTLVMTSSNGYYGGEYHNIGTEYVLVTQSFVCDGGSNQIFCIANHSANVIYSIKAIKLELGTEQTLAHQDENGNWVLNEIPDYGEQLARCQRYYYKPDRVILIRTPNTNSYTINANFKTTMRTAPTVAFGTEMTALVPGVTDAAKVSLQYAYVDENGIGDGDFISFTPADAEIFQVKGGQFSFSADL